MQLRRIAVPMLVAGAMLAPAASASARPPKPPIRGGGVQQHHQLRGHLPTPYPKRYKRWLVVLRPGR